MTLARAERENGALEGVEKSTTIDITSLKLGIRPFCPLFMTFFPTLWDILAHRYIYTKQVYRDSELATA